MKPSHASVIIGLAVGLFGAVVGKIGIRSYFEWLDEPQIDASLLTAERELNASTPKMLDHATRLDSSKAGPGKRFTYNCTLVGLNGADVDVASWKAKAVPAIRLNMKNGPLRPMFERGVTVIFRYLGSDGALVANVVMTPEEAFTKDR